MAVQKFLVYNSDPITWSDGTLFNGYVLMALVFPSANSGNYWDYAVLNDNEQRLRVPSYMKFPIREGYIVDNCYLWGNSGSANSINPPKTNYSPFFYDNTNRLIAIDTGTYAINADLEIVAPTLTIPTSSSWLGAPQTVPNTVPVVETPTGDIDGSNVDFTLSRVPNQLILYYATNAPLVQGVDFTRSGAAITMTTPPTDESKFKAFIF